MIDLGSGIAIAGVCVPAAAVWIAAIRTKKPANGKGNGNGYLCKEHSGLVSDIRHIREGQERQEEWLQEISKDVKELMRR